MLGAVVPPISSNRCTARSELLMVQVDVPIPLRENKRNRLSLYRASVCVGTKTHTDKSSFGPQMKSATHVSAHGTAWGWPGQLRRKQDREVENSNSLALPFPPRFVHIRPYNG